ncbi:glycosyltransferase involved in cell wall biosynthesis [Gramella sp. Hel_I_59]|uniref:glycosyltransferase n=1 Tax=Gramella sp. Hel_I_59 TaxID=1249978 RepID=UPI00114E540B|nr:glycosyltransferase [Gramella sp. Hel_I_59]TQI71547.1 glycosyltransferase involved in cell wall biosynthesis [Gramella sp. Hel_I_59]
MKVLIVNTFDYGGAATACKRLHLGLLAEGINSKVLLKNKINDWPESHCFEPVESSPGLNQRMTRKVRRLSQEFKLTKPSQISSPEKDFLNNRENGLEMFSFPSSHLDITQSPLYKEADIINLHWVANFLDLGSFFKKNTKPVVWTLHDMNPFSGGEHYEEKYLNLNEFGEPLEREYTKIELEFIKRNLEFKKSIFSKTPKLQIVSPSKWLMKEALSSEVFGEFDVKHIPYGLDSEVFKPLDKAYSKEILNIPQGKKVILFVADSLSNQRKGFEYLRGAFQKLDRHGIVLCAVGKKDLKNSSENIIELGSIKDERLMSAAYSAADVFVIPSIMDNLPNTVLESLMSGTPVIGFPIGGIPDMIDHGQNGILVDKVSVNALKTSIDYFLEHGVQKDIKEIIRDAQQKYDQKIQARAYIDLFSECLEKTN